MSDFESLPANPDILAIPQEQVVMLVLSQSSGIARKDLHPNFFDFRYESVNDTTVNVYATGRAYSKTGEKGKWSGTKMTTLVRAKLNRGNKPIVLTIGFRSGMSMEHVLRALAETYSFHVTESELLLRNASTGVYEAFSLASRPPAETLQLKFSPTQARIVPTDSEFSIVLDNTMRPDISDYLQVIKAGSVLGGL